MSARLTSALALTAVGATGVCATPAGAGRGTIAGPAHTARAHIYVVASKSFCLASGISDTYTGEGRIIFYVTLRNSGNTSGKVSITPVRHYDDGEMNQSPLDMLIDITVPPKTTKRFKSPLYKYKAHEHEIEACGLRIGTAREVPIQASHL